MTCTCALITRLSPTAKPSMTCKRGAVLFHSAQQSHGWISSGMQLGWAEPAHELNSGAALFHRYLNTSKQKQQQPTLDSSMNFFQPQSCSFLQKRCSVSEYLDLRGSWFTTAIVNCGKTAGSSIQQNQQHGGQEASQRVAVNRDRELWRRWWHKPAANMVGREGRGRGTLRSKKASSSSGSSDGDGNSACQSQQPASCNHTLLLRRSGSPGGSTQPLAKRSRHWLGQQQHIANIANRCSDLTSFKSAPAQSGSTPAAACRSRPHTETG